MNFSLQYIESELEESVLLRAEALLEADAVEDLHEIQRHLWVAKVQEAGRHVETEVKISPSKVKAASCECVYFQQHSMCAHVAATLLALRRNIVKHNTQKPDKQDNISKKLTVGAILEQVPHHDLITFVQQYARTNRTFALALKTRFATQMPDIDSKEKYIQLLDATINSARRPDRTFNRRGTGSIHKILLELNRQAEAQLLVGHFAEAVFIAQSIIEKTAPLLRKMQAQAEEIRQEVKTAFDTLRHVIAQQPPPSLREALWRYTLEESEKLTYRINQVDSYFFRLLLSLAEEDAQAEQLLVLFQERIRRYMYEKRDITPLVLQKLTLLENMKRDTDAEQLLQRYMQYPEVLLLAIQRAIEKSDFKQAKNLIFKALEKSPPKPLQDTLEENLLQIAQQEQNKTDIVQLAQTRLLHTFKVVYYELWRQFQSEQSAAAVSELLQALQERPYAPEKHRLIALILQAEGRYEQLLQYLQQIQSLDLAQDFIPTLLAYNPAHTVSMCRQLAHRYLSGHVGRKPSEKVRVLVATLREAGAAELADHLIEALLADFPERHTLLEELETLHT
jgi:tetratricopeptide (TPR) repeat protein